MTPQDALGELLARVGAAKGEPVQISSDELSQWPVSTVAAMKAHKLLVQTRPAASIVCPGCERQCVMPVHLATAPGGSSATFIVCDKRSDINRVPVPIDRLEQWQVSGDAVAALLADLLQIRRGAEAQSSMARWEIGLLKGAHNRGYAVLLANGNLELSVAGHSMAVVDVLETKADQFTMDKQTLVRCVDAPVAGADGIESPAQRQERLKERIRIERSKGTRNYLAVVAKEEDITKARLQQILSKSREQK